MYQYEPEARCGGVIAKNQLCSFTEPRQLGSFPASGDGHDFEPATGSSTPSRQ